MLFREPRTIYDASRETKRAYSSCHKSVKQLYDLGLLRIKERGVSTRNPKLTTIVYELTDKGSKVLEAFQID